MPSNTSLPGNNELYKYLSVQNVKKCYSTWNGAMGAECTYCGSFIKTCNNTSNARRHLVTKHADEISSAMLHDRQEAAKRKADSSAERQITSTASPRDEVKIKPSVNNSFLIF
jgi:hypothetical protein